MDKSNCLNNLSKFLKFDQTIQQQETFKERTGNVGELINAFTKSDDYNADKQKIFEFEFFTGGVNQKFNSFVRKFGLTTDRLLQRNIS